MFVMNEAVALPLPVSPDFDSAGVVIADPGGGLVEAGDGVVAVALEGAEEDRGEGSGERVARGHFAEPVGGETVFVEGLGECVEGPGADGGVEVAGEGAEVILGDGASLLGGVCQGAEAEQSEPRRPVRFSRDRGGVSSGVADRDRGSESLRDEVSGERGQLFVEGEVVELGGRDARVARQVEGGVDADFVREGGIVEDVDVVPDVAESPGAVGEDDADRNESDDAGEGKEIERAVFLVGGPVPDLVRRQHRELGEGEGGALIVDGVSLHRPGAWKIGEWASGGIEAGSLDDLIPIIL